MWCLLFHGGRTQPNNGTCLCWTHICLQFCQLQLYHPKWAQQKSQAWLLGESSHLVYKWPVTMLFSSCGWVIPIQLAKKAPVTNLFTSGVTFQVFDKVVPPLKIANQTRHKYLFLKTSYVSQLHQQTWEPQRASGHLPMGPSCSPRCACRGGWGGPTAGKTAWATPDIWHPSLEAGGKRDPRGNRNFKLPIQVVRGQAGSRSFKIEMLIAYRVEQKLHP